MLKGAAYLAREMQGYYRAILAVKWDSNVLPGVTVKSGHSEEKQFSRMRLNQGI